MGLPGVKINIENGNLGGTLTLNDGTSAIIATGVAVANAIVLDTPYLVSSLKDAETKLGLNKTGSNAFIYSIIEDYYTALAANTPLYLMIVSSTVTMEQMLDSTKPYVAALQAHAKGKIRLFAVSRKSATGVTLANGVDVDKAMIKGQANAIASGKKIQPFHFIVDGKDYNGNAADLKDYNTANYNRGSVLLLNKLGVKNNRVGMMLGGLSKNDVQRKISRVKNGALNLIDSPYIGTNSVEQNIDYWNLLHDKGYVFLRTFQGKSGYYFSSDRTATSTTDDYMSIARGRVIDKALLIAYATYVDELDDDVQIDTNGKLPVPLVKLMEGNIENAINRNMSDAISSVRAIIDKDQNILSNSNLKVGLRLIPLGYTSEIVVSLGFENPKIKV